MYTLKLVNVLKLREQKVTEVISKYVERLWKLAPPGLGGFIDPCDYCILRDQIDIVCHSTKKASDCVSMIKSLVRTDSQGKLTLVDLARRQRDTE